MRFLLPTALVLLAASVSAAEPRELRVLQEAVRKTIADAEPSIACILVSRSEKYREFDAAPSTIPGKLGSFVPPVALDAAKRELIRRLDLANPEPLPEAYGSGVVIDASGLVLTPFHVVQDATKIYVRLSAKKGSYADIYAADGRSDLAVLKLIDPPAELKPIRVGDAGKTQKGDFVVGLIHPFAAGFRGGGPTASSGIISDLFGKPSGNNMETERVKPLQQLVSLLKTDLRLSIGNSGGAVLNLDGELIGLASSKLAILGDPPSVVALPLDGYAKRALAVLKRGEEVEYGFLGVSFSNTRDHFNLKGLPIDGVADGTPAKRAGLEQGETIMAVNDAPIRHFEDLQLNIGWALAGSEVTVSLQNFRGKARQVKVKLAKASSPYPTIAAKRPQAVHGLRVDYNSVVNSDKVAIIPDGVYIREVERGSAAEKKYKDLLDRGSWIITSVNGKAVPSPADFYREAAVKGPLELRIVEVVPNPETTARTITLP